MASHSTQIFRIALPELCSSCGHTQTARADGENAKTSDTADHVNLASKDDSARASRQLLPNTPELAIYLANLLLIGGAVAISVLPSSASSPLTFGGFLIGHVCLSMHAIRLRDRGLLFLNAALAILDLYAAIIRL
jgi:hypothetical protein